MLTLKNSRLNLLNSYVNLEWEQRQRSKRAGPTLPTFRGNNALAQTLTAPAWLLSGPAETGKTWAALYRLDSEARRVAGGQFALIRKVRNDMDGTVLVTWRKLIALRGEVTAFGGEKVQWYDYPNGSRVWIGGLDRPEKTLSGERDGVCVSQAEELAEADWELLIRSTTGRGARTTTPMLFGDCNPGPEDHWIIRRRDSHALTLLETSHEDNPTLHDGKDWTPQGRKSLAALDTLTGVRYQRLRLGRWVGAEGQYFDQLDESRHVIDLPTLPPGYDVWAALDYGFTHPLAFGVYCQSPDGVIIKIGLHTAAKWYIAQHCAAMDDLLDSIGVPKRGLRIVAGHDCWATGKDETETIADKFKKHGYVLEKAQLSRIIGARALGERLGNPAANVKPTLFFARQCRATLPALARMVHDPRNPEDVLKINADASGRGGDDVYDETRYGIMAASSRPKRIAPGGGSQASRWQEGG